ncbi:TniQ family protein [Xanthomonas campestris pv. campestris]|uniref:TniQ family protein n=1 Tax=Xanthomonas campestris TaxID=339 RepID=UPI0032E3D995
MHWPLPLEPHEDELLSSFLVRSAHRHGLSPYRFCAFHFPGASVWNRDIDYSASDALLAAIAVKAGLTPARVMQMKLRSVEGRLEKGLARGSAPWINRVGIYHRLRRRWGLQYCPDCLAERPVLYRAWRMSCIVVCSRHRRLLQDACPHCDAPLAIHRQLLSAQLCHHCSRVLGRTPEEPNVSIDTVLRAQSYFQHVLQSGTAEIGGLSVCSEELFQGARVLASLLAPASLPQYPAEHYRPSLEQARVQARACIVLRVAKVLALWPIRFRQTASEQHLTQRSFARRSLPDWLKSAVDELPAGRTRHALPRKHHSLRAKLEQDRRRNADWRSARAALLWHAASK